MDLIKFNGNSYPSYETSGNMTQYVLPFVKHICKGEGYDIGCNNLGWAVPWATPVDILISANEYEALNLPDEKVDFIYSSHCLEHLPNWVDALEYWIERIKAGGILFLYLPHYNQEYWRPWNCRRHMHCLNGETIEEYLKSTKKFRNIFVGGMDLNHSFAIVAEKYWE